MTKQQALEKAIHEGGGVAEVARYISEHFEPITPQAVSKWDVCPPRRVQHVTAAAKARGGKTKARDLCPELFEARAA